MSNASEQPVSQPPGSGVDAIEHGRIAQPGTAINTPSLDINFDTMAALLGGAKASELLANHADANHVVAMLDGPRAWLSPGLSSTEPSAGILKQHALEIASLKLRCFDSLIRVLIGNHLQHPVSKTEIQGRLLDRPGSMTPTRWSLEVCYLPSSPNASQADKQADVGPSLGSVLAHLLLANDECSPQAAESLVASVVAVFEAQAASKVNPAADELEEIAHLALSHSAIAKSCSLIYKDAIRDRVASSAVPAHAWLGLTTVMLRLHSSVPGFSLRNASLIDICASLTPIAQQLDIATFGAIAQRDEIAAIVRNQLAKLGQVL